MNEKSRFGTGMVFCLLETVSNRRPPTPIVFKPLKTSEYFLNFPGKNAQLWGFWKKLIWRPLSSPPPYRENKTWPFFCKHLYRKAQREGNSIAKKLAHQASIQYTFSTSDGTRFKQVVPAPSFTKIALDILYEIFKLRARCLKKCSIWRGKPCKMMIKNDFLR